VEGQGELHLPGYLEEDEDYRKPEWRRVEAGIDKTMSIDKTMFDSNSLGGNDCISYFIASSANGMEDKIMIEYTNNLCKSSNMFYESRLLLLSLFSPNMHHLYTQ